jgi:hypothetical protein
MTATVNYNNTLFFMVILVFAISPVPVFASASIDNRYYIPVPIDSNYLQSIPHKGESAINSNIYPASTVEIIKPATEDKNGTTDMPINIAEVTRDSEFECGNKFWGIRDHRNFYQGAQHIFAKSSDCRMNDSAPSMPNENGTTNYLKLVSQNKNNDDEDIAFEAGLQGTTPWGFNSKDDGGAALSNEMMPLPTDLDYQLEAEYMWLDNEISRPSEEGNVKANLNVDLWFADTKSPRTEDGQYKNIMIIDFSFANLENRDGHWRIRDSAVEGQSYFRPYAFLDDNGQTRYTFNAVLDTDGKEPGKWYAPSPSTYTKTIKQFIDDAFNYEYETKDGESQRVDNPVKSNYELIDIEAGAEVWTENKESSGTIVAGYSKVKLMYKK